MLHNYFTSIKKSVNKNILGEQKLVMRRTDILMTCKKELFYLKSKLCYFL